MPALCWAQNSQDTPQTKIILEKLLDGCKRLAVGSTRAHQPEAIALELLTTPTRRALLQGHFYHLMVGVRGIHVESPRCADSRGEVDVSRGFLGGERFATSLGADAWAAVETAVSCAPSLVIGVDAVIGSGTEATTGNAQGIVKQGEGRYVCVGGKKQRVRSKNNPWVCMKAQSSSYDVADILLILRHEVALVKLD